jgi:hypothetical protein
MRTPSATSSSSKVKIALACIMGFILLLIVPTPFQNNNSTTNRTGGNAIGVGGNPNEEYGEEDPGNVTPEQEEVEEKKSSPNKIAEIMKDGNDCQRKM